MISTRPRALFTLLVAFAFSAGFDLFQTRSGAVEEGNRLLRAGKLKEALAAYQRAAKELPDEPGVQYNLGIALHRLGQLEKARDALSQATLAAPRALRQKAFYNLGNAQFELKKYKEAAAAYTRALQLDPDHAASRWNLELALRRLQEEEKQKQKQDKKDQKQDRKDQKDQKQDRKDQQEQKQGADQKRPADKKQDRKDPNEEKKQAKKEQQKKQPEQRDGAKAGQKPPEMDNVLDALDRNDRNLQRRRARVVPGGLTRPSKDW